MGFLRIITVTQGRVIYGTIRGILRSHLGGSRFVRKIPLHRFFIPLFVKMIVILGVNDRRNLIEPFWTRLFKGGQLKPWNIAL